MWKPVKMMYNHNMIDATFCNFLLDAAYIFLLCGVLSFVMHALHQSSITGYMVLGIIAATFDLIPSGWWGLIENVGKIGILLLLFTAGLEINISEFLSISPVAVYMLLIELLCSTLICGLCGFYFGASLKSIILWIFVCTLSSTAVTLKNLQHTKSTYKLYALYAMSVLVAQDICFSSMQLILQSVGNHDSLTVLMLEILSSVLIPLVPLTVVFAFLYFVDLRYTQHIKVLPEYYLWIVLGSCFATAGLFGILKISVEYGAFLGGLLCGGVGDRHNWYRAIEPIVKITSAIFFMWVGMTTDLQVIHSNILLLTLCVLCILIIKTVVNVVGFYLVTKSAHSLQAGLLLVTLSEFSFPLIETYNAHDFTSEFLKALVIISMMLGGIWYELLSTPTKE
jgi:CPA2 family monovalent cation:H+ antiporter-2